MKNRRIISVVFAWFLVQMTFAQVGINIETPEANLDVVGDVRLRKLDNPVPYNRMILANEAGDIGYSDLGSDSYMAKDILFRNQPGTVHSTIENPSDLEEKELVDLSMEIKVEVAPHSSTAIAVEYNIPIAAVLTNPTPSTEIPGYIGITLIKEENNVKTELDEGSRKFTMYDVPVNYNGSKYITLPVSGKATDIITNDSDQIKYITYAAKGYIEHGRGTMYFGNPPNSPTNFGMGVLIVQVYEKRL